MAALNYLYVLSFFTVVIVRAGRLLLALYALRLDAEPFTVGLLAATFSFLPMTISYWVGRISDRFGSRWPMLWGIAGGGIGILVPFFFENMVALFIAAILNGFAFAFYNVALQNAIGLVSTPENRTKNFSNFTMVVSIGTLVGPMLTGFSVDWTGHVHTCLWIALVTLIPIAMLMISGGILPLGSGKKEKAASGNMMEVLTDPGMRRTLILSSLMQTGFDLFNFYMPVYAHSVGLSASATGVLAGVFAIAGFSVRMILDWLIKRFTVETVLKGAFILSALGWFLVPFFTDILMLCVISFVFGFGISIGQPITLSLSFSNAKDGRSGEAMGVRLMVNHGTRVVVPLLFGTIGTAFGAFPVFWINGLMLLSGLLLTRKGQLVAPKD